MMSRTMTQEQLADVVFIDDELANIHFMFNNTQDKLKKVAYKKIHLWLMVSRNRIVHGIGEEL